MIKQFDNRRQQQVAWFLLLLIVILYIVEMSHQALLRYDTFKATAFDLGNMDQVLWNTIHGRWFQFTNQAVDWYGPPTRLAVHFEPILLPLSLLYAFHADPRILLVFQTLALASGALPVFLLTRKYVPDWPILAALLAGAYLLSPALLGMNIFDFHPISLATPFLLFAVLALTYKRYGWFLCCCILAASCKEDVPLSLAILGLFLIWKYKLPRLGLALTLGGLLWSYIAFGIIIPHFYPGAQSNNFWYRYEALGSSPAAAIVNLLLHPWLLFTTFITLDRFYYLAGLLRSTGFLCLLAPEWLLLALPGLAENLLSTDALIYSGVYHYNAAIIPFVMISAIHGARRLLILWRIWRGEKGPALAAQSVVENAQQGPGLRVWLELKAAAILPGKVLAFCQRLGLAAYNRIRVIWDSKLLVRFRTDATKKAIIQWQQFSQRMAPLASSISVRRLQWLTVAWIAAMAGLNFLIFAPLLNAFWADHDPGSREQHIQQILAMIPPDASVAAGNNLNPHVSERQQLAVFPSINDSNQDTPNTVQYIIVDLTAVFPEDRVHTANVINHLIHSGQYMQLADAEGVVLLVRRST